MALGKKISKLFKHKERESGSNTALQVDQTATPIILPTVPGDDELNTIAAVVQASLEDEISRLEGYSQEQTTQLSRQEYVNAQAAQEIHYLSGLLASRSGEHASSQTRAESAGTGLNELHVTHANEVFSLGAKLQTVSNHLTAEREENSRLAREHATLQDDYRALYDSNRKYEAWVPQANARFAEQERKVRHLEQRLALALQPMDEDSRRAFEEGSRGAREKEELKRRFDGEKTVMSQQIQALNENFHQKEEERRALESRVSAFEAGLQEEKSQHQDAKAIIQALQANEESMQEDFEERGRQLAQLRSLFGPGPTPRQVLFLNLFTRRFPRLQQEVIRDSDFLRSYRAEDLNVEDLDASLTDQTLAKFVSSVSPGSPGYDAVQRMHFKRCSECKRYKINGSCDGRNQSLIEFPTRFRHTCCRTASICTDCLKEKLKTAITQDWWHELDREQWLKCPVPGCGQALEIRRTEGFDDLLRDFADGDVALLKAMYRYALAFREALTRIERRPSLEAISTSIGLHQQLSAFGLFADQFSVLFIHDCNAAEPFDVGEVLMGSLDRDDLEIPIFTKFFPRLATPKDCSICCESFHEIDVESEEQWSNACEGYNGSWMSQVFSFPTRNTLRCDHDMDVCKRCLAHHLESRLDQHGRNVMGRFTCPICNRVLSETEIRCLGSAETVQRYDKYLLLSHLSSDPDFRTCLRAGCENGEIYEQDEYPNPNITCSSCDFKMCFTHQIPWHSGLSCDQYDSQQQHGDPEYQQTRDWMQSNSKTCPGANCNISVEKGNACFHMTCGSHAGQPAKTPMVAPVLTKHSFIGTQCRHEFCWECLADWSRINPQPGTFVKEAHNEGCWFREGDLEPTQISGTDLQTALRRRQGR